MSYPPTNEPTPGNTEPAYPEPSTPQPSPATAPPSDQARFGGYYYLRPGYGPPLPTKNGLAITSMILGIVGLVLTIFFIGIICSILAVIFGHVALNQIKQSKGVQSGRGFAIAGLVTGYIIVGGLALVIVIGIIAGIAQAMQH